MRYRIEKSYAGEHTSVWRCEYLGYVAEISINRQTKHITCNSFDVGNTQLNLNTLSYPHDLTNEEINMVLGDIANTFCHQIDKYLFCFDNKKEPTFKFVQTDQAIFIMLDETTIEILCKDSSSQIRLQIRKVVPDDASVDTGNSFWFLYYGKKRIDDNNIHKLVISKRFNLLAEIAIGVVRYEGIY